jgi:titin
MPTIEYEKKYSEILSLKAGSSLNLPVTVTGVPTPKVTWSLNDKTVAASMKTKLESRDMHYSLTTRDVSREDGGIYTVTAENVVGRKHATFEVKIKGE